MAPALIENCSVRDIERELGRLRDACTDPGQPPQLRASTMTHVAWVPERWVGAVRDVLAGLEERYPSRLIVLYPRPDEPRDALDADVDLRCFVRGGESREVCSEVIEIRLCGRRAAAPASVVAPLLIVDLPVFLRWRGEPRWGIDEFEQLVGVADRLVVDSAEWSDIDDALARLPELFDHVAVSDIAWGRTEPWREAIAALWPDVADAESLRVAGPRADALLLAGWLRGRLGRDVELAHEPAGEIEVVEVDGREAPRRRRERKTPADLLSDQLDLFTRDPIYEEAVRTFSSVPI